MSERDRRGSTVDTFQPGAFPEYEAGCLTPAVRLSITPDIQMNAVRKLAAFAGNDVTCLMRARHDGEPLSTVQEHLWHEWQTIETSIVVEGGQDLVLAFNLDYVASS
jgi:hypothetical protein